MTTTLPGWFRGFLVAMCLCGTGVFMPALAADPGEDKVKALQRERLATLREVADLTEAAARTGSVPVEKVIEARLAVFAAELELCAMHNERVRILEKTVVETRRLEAEAEKAVKSGTTPARVALIAKARRLEAEIALERAKHAKP